jgi:DNA-binding CsgD family transcriptional regulator
MTTPANESFRTLSDKEKQTLRLIVRGHDAKSIARSLGLSVHTINERLRDARRKMAVSSSREAARMLLEAEGLVCDPLNPDLFVDSGIGGAAGRNRMDQESASISGVRRASRHSWIIIGVCLMTFALGLLVLSALPQAASSPPPPPTTSQPVPSSEVVDTARQWLSLIDQARWDESYRATGAVFRKLNTVQVWTKVSEKVRAPLGAMISRTFVSQENLPAPPSGYEVVKFRTRFANKADVLETVTLDRADGDWRIVGVTIG